MIIELTMALLTWDWYFISWMPITTFIAIVLADHANIKRRIKETSSRKIIFTILITLGVIIATIIIAILTSYN